MLRLRVFVPQVLVALGALCLPGHDALNDASVPRASSGSAFNQSEFASYKQGGVVHPFGGGGTFMFKGNAGESYVLLSAPAEGYQVAATVQDAGGSTEQSSEHSDISLEAVHFLFQNAHVVVKTNAADAPLVYLDGDEVTAGETWLYETRRSTDAGNAPLSIQFKQFVPEFGTIINITTDVVHAFITTVPEAKDDKGRVIPSYLNLQVTLQQPPASRLEGVLGETYGWRSALSHPDGEELLIAEEPHQHFPSQPASAYVIPAQAIPLPPKMLEALKGGTPPAEPALSRRLLRSSH